MLGISERLYFWVLEGAPDVNGLMFNDCVFNQLGLEEVPEEVPGLDILRL